MIVKEKNEWVLRSKDGSKVLGRHSSEAAARQQEWAIEAAKRARGEKD